MTSPLQSAKFTREILLPAWIVCFGLAVLNAPVMGVAASLLMLTVGLVVVPGLILMSRPEPVPALITETRAGL